MGAGQGGTFRLVIARTQQPLATRASFASTFRQRLTGFLGRSSIDDGEALIFTNCRSIHTIGMRCAIDVVMVDTAWRVVAVRPRVAPGRWLLPVSHGWGAIETGAGVVPRSGLVVGDQLRVVPATETSSTC